MARAHFHRAPRCESGLLPQPSIRISYRRQSSLSWRSSQLCLRRGSPARPAAPSLILFLEANPRCIPVRDTPRCAPSVGRDRALPSQSSPRCRSLAAHLSPIQTARAESSPRFSSWMFPSRPLPDAPLSTFPISQGNRPLPTRCVMSVLRSAALSACVCPPAHPRPRAVFPASREKRLSFEKLAEEAASCWAERGTRVNSIAPSTSTRLKLHSHPTHFIGVSAPLVQASTAGDPPLRRMHYTHARSPSQFEI